VALLISRLFMIHMRVQEGRGVFSAVLLPFDEVTSQEHWLYWSAC
jgi:hypothetical protein